MRPSFGHSPLLVFWETTRACDLACAHCRACAIPERDPRELSTEEGRDLLSSAADLGAKLVVLTGGDPAKRPDLPELVRHGTSIGLRMALTPSATPLVTADWLKELADAGLARIAISIDGSAPATHDGFRAVEGTFARSMGILWMARALGLTTQVNTTVTQRNQREIPEIARMLCGMDIELWSVFFVVPTGRADSSLMLDCDATERMLEWLADVIPQVPYDIKTTAAPHFRRVLLQRKQRQKDIVGLDRDGIGRAPRGINDGSGIIFVSHTGDLYPSGFMPIRCGNVRHEGLAHTYRSNPLFQVLRDTEALQGKCGRCEFRKVCGGSRARAFAVTGDPVAQEPTCAYQPAS